jgi:hypothetical protein
MKRYHTTPHLSCSFALTLTHHHPTQGCATACSCLGRTQPKV